MNYPLVISPFDQDDISIMMDTIRSGQFTMGPKVREFESAFAQQAGSRFAVMTNSGSSANLIAAFALLYRKKNPIPRGSEVLVPAIGWSTTWAPLQQAGFRLKIVDINPETLNVDVEAYAQAITPETRMIVTVSVLGNPLEFESLRRICDEKDIFLFEDNCESIGATVNGKWCGTFGDLGTFSFFYSHHISTIEGGMVVTDDEELYHLLLSLRAHGWTREIPEQTSVEGKLKNELREHYNFIVPGFNVRPMEISGAVGLNQLRKLDRCIELRRHNAALFQNMMRSHPMFSIQHERHGQSSWYSFPVILNTGTTEDRDRLFFHLHTRKIESRMITGGCLTLHPMKKYFDLIPSPPPQQAERIHNTGLFVANHAADMTSMLDALDRALAEFGL